MNILFLTDGITPYNTGGMQKHSYVMSKLLAKNNCNITLVHCGYFNKNDFYEDYNEIFTAAELSVITPVFIPFICNGKLPGHYVSESKLYSKNIKNHIGNGLSKFDLIYAQGFTGWAFLKNQFNIPLAVNLHGYEMYQKAPNNRVKMEHYLLRPFVKKIINNADFVLSFGGQIDHILKNLKIDPLKIIQQSNGIESSWVKTEEPVLMKTRTITFIGRYERRKGIKELTQALSELLKKDIKFQFNFIGPIPKEFQLRHSNIKYLGEIKSTTIIKKVLDHSDYLISPSYAEGMPTVILEAMARGNAIIATDVGANTKMISSNGWLIENSIIAIKKALFNSITIKDAKLLEMKKDSVTSIKTNFIWENVIKKQLSVLQSLTLK